MKAAPATEELAYTGADETALLVALGLLLGGLGLHWLGRRGLRRH